jgi:tetratricopeptide (TPR) repeat protein
MFLRSTAVLALIGFMSSAVPAQAQQSSIVLDTDIRIFTVAAALRVASSTDDGKFGTDLDPDLVGRLKQYYSARKGNRSDDSQYARYFGLAVSLTDPPEMKPRFREEQLPDETRALLSFQELLREFYLKARISQRWEELRPKYEAELSRVKPKIAPILLQTDAYLRTSLSGAGPRVMHIDVELQAPPNSVNMRVYQNDYYVVLGPSIASGPATGTATDLDAFRHAYLHFHLDDVVNRNIMKIENNERLLALVAREEGVDTAYTKQMGLMTVESLIRAMEPRIDRATTARASEIVATAYRSGLLLTPYFYEALQAYQGNLASFRDVYAEVAGGIRFSKENDRFKSTFHSIPAPRRAATDVPSPDSQLEQDVPVDPMRQLIVEAQTAFNSMDNVGARALFEKVLREFDPNSGAALYGLGLLASRAADVEQSQLYFERTLKSNSADTGMKVWSYIYLGRIADLQCERDRARAYYNQAVQVGDDSRNAQTTAKDGLAKAYGDQCR